MDMPKRLEKITPEMLFKQHKNIWLRINNHGFIPLNGTTQGLEELKIVTFIHWQPVIKALLKAYMIEERETHPQPEHRYL